MCCNGVNLRVRTEIIRCCKITPIWSDIIHWIWVACNKKMLHPELLRFSSFTLCEAKSFTCQCYDWWDFSLFPSCLLLYILPVEQINFRKDDMFFLLRFGRRDPLFFFCLLSVKGKTLCTGCGLFIKIQVHSTVIHLTHTHTQSHTHTRFVIHDRVQWSGWRAAFLLSLRVMD